MRSTCEACEDIGGESLLIWTYGGILSMRLEHHPGNLRVTGELSSAVKLKIQFYNKGGH